MVDLLLSEPRDGAGPSASTRTNLLRHPLFGRILLRRPEAATADRAHRTSRRERSRRGCGHVRLAGSISYTVSVGSSSSQRRRLHERHRRRRPARTAASTGISCASAEKRPALLTAVREACRTKAILVVYSLSRLARSTMDALVISERLQRAGADLVSLSEKIDTTTAAGKMVFRMLAVLAEFERDQLSERTKTAMAHLRGQGKRISRHIPFGWDLAPCGELLVLNKVEQGVIELIRELREAGLSYRRIAEELKERRVRTKQGKSTWSPKVIRDLVTRQESAA